MLCTVTTVDVLDVYAVDFCITVCLSRVYIAALIRPYVPVLFAGALILGTGGGGE